MPTPGLGFNGQIAPTASLFPFDWTAREAIVPELEPGENLLWAARAKFSGLDLGAILFGATWAFALVQRMLDPSHPWTNHAQIVLYSVIMLMLCVVTLFLRGGIFYGVTDRRVLWLSNRKKSLFDLPLCDALGHPLGISLLPFGILSFGGRTAEALSRPKEAYFSFFIGSKAPAVCQMIVEAARKLVDEAENAAIVAHSPDVHK